MRDAQRLLPRRSDDAPLHEPVCAVARGRRTSEDGRARQLMRGRAYRRLWRRGCPRAALRQRTSCAWPLGAQGERVVGRRGARVRRSLPRDLCEAERLITALAQISAPMHAPEHLSMPRCLACQAGPGSCAALYGHVRRTAWASGCACPLISRLLQVQCTNKSIFWAVTLADVLAEEAASEKAAPELPVLRCGRGIC